MCTKTTYLSMFLSDLHATHGNSASWSTGPHCCCLPVASLTVIPYHASRGPFGLLPHLQFPPPLSLSHPLSSTYVNLSAFSKCTYSYHSIHGKLLLGRTFFCFPLCLWPVESQLFWKTSWLLLCPEVQRLHPIVNSQIFVEGSHRNSVPQTHMSLALTSTAASATLGIIVCLPVCKVQPGDRQLCGMFG